MTSAANAIAAATMHVSTETVAEIVKALLPRGASLTPSFAACIVKKMTVTMQLYALLAACSQQIGDVCACLMLE